MRSILSGFVAAAVFAGAWACGGGGGYGGPPSGPTPNPGAANVTISIVGDRGTQSFNPNPAVAGGEMVVFRNTDSVVHRVRLNDLSIDTGDIPPGGTSRAFRMPNEGTNYHCSLHTNMRGSISTLTAPPPTCTGQYC